MRADLIRANKDEFAVYQTIYSGADTNLQFDWEGRLGHTTWTEDCYWVVAEGRRIGGILVLQDCTRLPFLIEPFCDRALFWRMVVGYLRENRPEIHKLYSVLDDDVSVLQALGSGVERARRMMCRPTEVFQLDLDDAFTWDVPELDRDLEEMVDVMVRGYEGGIDHQLAAGWGAEERRQEIRSDLVACLEGYIITGTRHHLVVRSRAGNQIVALCLAGCHPDDAKQRFAGISELAVLPECRGRGLAKYMLRYALTKAAETCDVMMLCVTTGNNAEGLYREMGFWGGPRFTNMIKL